jgi:ribosomal 50S subunit-recycling heat shock protein
MRLDKFLKVSRLIKRRTLAKEVADQGRIKINGIEGKASSNVKVGDMLTIRFGQKLVTIEINSIQENSKKEEASQMYTIVKEEKLDNEVSPF